MQIDGNDTRLFDEQEIVSILKKAAEYQGETNSSDETGLSLAELAIDDSHVVKSIDLLDDLPDEPNSHALRDQKSGRTKI